MPTVNVFCVGEIHTEWSLDKYWCESTPSCELLPPAKRRRCDWPGLSVRLFVSMIAHKVLYRFAWKCNQRCGSRQFSQSTSESKNSWQDYLRLRVKTKLNIISPQIHKTFEEIWRHYFDFQVNITNSFNSRYLGFRDSRHTWCRWNFSRGAQCGNFSSYRISTDKNEWALLSCS